MSDYRIVTISNRQPTEWYYLQREFYQSLQGYGVDTFTGDTWRGLATKPKWLYSVIKSGMIPEKHMIFCDSWDLVFARTPDDVMKEYHEFNSDIVISAERNCFPLDHKKAYDKFITDSPYKYLNSGFIVGETEAILTCLEAMDLPNVEDDYRREDGTNYHSNDQELWQQIFLQQPVKIALDREQILSQTLHDADINDFDLSGKFIKNKTTESYPCTFHFNGGSKDKLELRNPILQKLNLLNEVH